MWESVSWRVWYLWICVAGYWLLMCVALCIDVCVWWGRCSSTWSYEHPPVWACLGMWKWKQLACTHWNLYCSTHTIEMRTRGSRAQLWRGSDWLILDLKYFNKDKNCKEWKAMRYCTRLEFTILYHWKITSGSFFGEWEWSLPLVNEGKE